MKKYELNSFLRSEYEILDKIAVDIGKDIFSLQFSQLCEVKVLSKILSDLKTRKKLLNKFDTVTIHNGKGPDIVFSNKHNNDKLKIEVKGSLLKNDYMNKNEYSRKRIKFWGNGLKKKDFDSDTGLLVADIVILVCCEAEDKRIIDSKTDWRFLVFNNTDIQNLEPKSTIFFPTYCITTMIDEKKSFFTDEYSGLHKGLVQLIQFKKTDDENFNKQVEKDFKKVWLEIDCYLYQREHNAIVETIWQMKNNNWSKLIIHKNQNSGKFKMSNLIKTHKCGLLEMPSNKTHYSNCQACKGFLEKSKQ